MKVDSLPVIHPEDVYSTLPGTEYHYGNFLDKIPVAVLVINKDGNIVVFNEASENLFGWSSKEILNKSLSCLTNQLSHKKHLKYLQTYEEDMNLIENKYQHVIGCRKDGSQFNMKLCINTIKQNDIVYFVIGITDVTEFKTKIDHQVQVAKTATKSKMDFLANMSHELRTPLNAIIGFSDIMLNELFGNLSKQYKEYAKHINDSGQHLLAIINDILDLSRVDSGNIELNKQECSIDEIIDSSVNMIKSRASDKHIDINHVLSDLLVNIDPLRIKQVFLNVLTNSIKFTKSNGCIDISSKINNDNIQIIIQDDGIGMTEEELEIALTRFGRVENVYNGNIEGTGLGLPLSVNLVNLHNGTFEMISEPNKGTKTCITLPLN